MDWTTYLFRFDGRINRVLMCQALLIVMVLSSLVGTIDRAIHVIDGQRSFCFTFAFDFALDDLFGVVDPRAWRLLPSADLPSLVLKVLSTALFLWIYLATTIKRLHDRNRRGWWIILFFFVPGLFDQFADLLPDTNWAVAVAWTFHIQWLWGFVEMFLLRGTSGANRFGPDPLADIEGASARPPAKPWDQQRELEFVPHSASPPGGMHVKRGP
jgi:uncharacterized membrane protein YhaH (DUF805 family)